MGWADVNFCFSLLFIHSFIHSLIHSFSKFLLSICYVPGTIPESGNAPVGQPRGIRVYMYAVKGDRQNNKAFNNYVGAIKKRGVRGRGGGGLAF